MDITNEEAIKQIKTLKQELKAKYGDDLFQKMYAALDKAVEVLEQKPFECEEGESDEI